MLSKRYKGVNLKLGLSSALVMSLPASAGTLGDVIESYRQNRYSLANGAGSYDRADPADRRVIEQYYSELEASALLSPMTNALEVTASNSQAMVSAIQRAITAADPVSADIESCLNTRELSVQQNVLSRNATYSRAQLEAGYSRSRYQTAPEFDLRGIADAYNGIAARDWTAEFLRCCKKESLNMLERSGTTDRRQTRSASLQRASDSNSRRLEQLYEGGGCNDLGREIAEKQTTFAQQNYFLPSRVIDPLEGLKMSAQELAEVLRSSSVRSGLRRIRENAHSPTHSMAAEMSYFEEIDTACKKAKEDELNKANSFWRVLAKTGANAAICHLIPFMATNNWSTNKAHAAYMVADATVGLPWKDLQCDPAVTAAYRSQRPTDINEVADKWNIPALQNPVFLNQLRSLVPLQQTFPVVRSPDGSIILPGGMIGGDAPTQEQVAAQLAAQQGQQGPFTPVVRFSTANRLMGNQSFSPNTSSASNRLAFLSGPSGSVSYVRSTNALAASGRALAPAVNGVRTLAGNISSGNTRAPASAGALKQSASQSRTLASSLVGAQQGRSLAVLSQNRSQSALQTRNLVGRAITSQSSRVSAEWIAKVLRDRRANNPQTPGGTDVVYRDGPRKIEPTADEKNQKIADELFKANQRRRDALLAQADSMVKAIQNAVTRSAEIVREIQSKIQIRDTEFNKTVEAMVKKPPKSQYSAVKGLINQDAVRMQELAILKAEYDALGSSIPMLTSSLNKLGGLSPQITNNINSGLGSLPALPSGGTDGRFNNSGGTSVFSTPNSSVAQPRVQGVDSEFAQSMAPTLIDLISIKLLPTAWAKLPKPGTLAYEQRWSLAYDTFAKDWEVYLKKLHDVEKADRAALVKRYRELRAAPNSLKLREPDAVTFSLMWETMEVISEETKYLVQNRGEGGRGNLARNKIYQDIEVAQQDAEATIDLLAEWGHSYIKSAPKSYYDDPQAWEAILPNAILY
jgi:F0F1-type ATP synthase membrane subunit b/b'